MRFWSVAVAVFVASASWGQLTSVEKKGLDEALYFGNMTEADLNFPREGVSGVATFPWVKEALFEPLKAADGLMAWHEAGLTLAPEKLVGSALAEGWPSLKGKAIEQPDIEAPAELPPKTGATVAKLVGVMTWADNEIREACKALTPEEFESLKESLAANAVEEKAVKISFVRNQPMSVPAMFALLKKVDTGRILEAGQRVWEATWFATNELKSNGEDVDGLVRVRVAGLMVEVGGKGDTTYDSLDARLTIDLGGNDTYRGRAGSGIGYTGVLIDLGGDDNVNVPDLSMGAGEMGIGCAVFLGGNDRFVSDSLGFGAGLAGVGVFYKQGGQDIYQSTSMAQGFGMEGLGLCYDSGGDDSYFVSLMGQGAARTRGVGWQIDRVGNDTYRAGGLVLNSPLFATAHYSEAQGISFGYREDTGGTEGGVGMLTDGGGDDVYWGETYCQAASYWFSVGSLYDRQGNDTYSATHYAQASAMHMTSAYLFDLNGDDSYSLRVGAGQGVGHDYGVGFLLDRAGDDLYASRDARPGSGLANGLGLFIDAAGVDKYTTLTAYGRFDRMYGSLGLFVDLEGSDFYATDPGTRGNDAATFDEGMTLAVDFGNPAAAGGGGGTEPTRPKVVPGSVPMPDNATMEKLYSLAIQWGVGTAQQEVADSLDKIVAIGVPALDWMLDKKLAGANRLSLRAFEHVVSALGEAALPSIGRKALSANDAETENLLRIATDAKVEDLGSIIPGIIAKKPALRRRAVQAAAALKARGATDSILPLVVDKDDPMLRREAMVALEQIGDKAAYGTGVSMMMSDDVLLRRSAERLVAKFPETALVTCQQILDETDEKRARGAIEVLGFMKDDRAIKMLTDSILDPRPGVRISALNALVGRLPKEAEATVKGLLNDPIAAVRMAARRVLP